MNVGFGAGTTARQLEGDKLLPDLPTSSAEPETVPPPAPSEAPPTATVAGADLVPGRHLLRVSDAK